MTVDIRAVHVVAEDAQPVRGGRPLTWGYGPAELRRVLTTAGEVAWSLRGIDVETAPGAMLREWMAGGVLPEPLALVSAGLRLTSSLLLASGLERLLDRDLASVEHPTLLHRRLLSSTPLPDIGQPCTGWGVHYLAALAGTSRERASVIAKRHRIEMSRPVAVVQLALLARGHHDVEAEVRRLLVAHAIRRGQSWG